MKIITVVGARPNFMKAAPILAAIQRHNGKAEVYCENRARGAAAVRIEHVLVHTGQHYDGQMSDAFFADLGLPRPDVHLGVGSGSHATQTAEVMRRFEEILVRERPAVVIVVGDVNSTVACALTTAKLPVENLRFKPLLAHVEAGLRSFDRTMPEEHNRVVSDHLSDILFVTEESGLRNLKREGIPSERVFFVGNTMIDSLLAFKDRADASPLLDRLGFRDGVPSNSERRAVRPYAVLTLHRPSNVDNREAFSNIVEGLVGLAERYPILFPVHPRTWKRIQEFGFDRFFQSAALPVSMNGHAKGIWLVEPLGYIDFLCLMKNARLVLTDSGGVQEETTCLGVPCVTIRENTERPATVDLGTNVLAGTSATGIRRAIDWQLRRSTQARGPAKWDGNAADRILEVLICVAWKQVAAL